MSTKHTATLPDGTIATRTSANRVYPFVIAIAPRAVGDVVASLTAEADESDRNGARYTATADYLDNGGELVVSTVHLWGDHSADYVLATGLPYNGASFEGVAERGITRIGGSGYPDVEAARTGVAAEMRRFAADATTRAAELRTAAVASTLGTWGAAAWSSRRELAERTAASIRAKDPRREVRVIDTERTSKP